MTPETHFGIGRRLDDPDRELVAQVVEVGVAQHLGRPGPREVDRHPRHDASGPGAHDHHLVGEEHRLRDRVGHEQGRAGPLGPDALELEVHPLPGHLVERPERLVEEEHLGLDHERPGDRDPLAHAARELGGPGLLEALQPHQLHEVGDVDRLLLHPRHLERQLDVGGHRAPRQQRGLLEGDADVVLAAGHGRRLAVDEHLSGRRLLEVGEDPQDRGLPAARRAEEGDEPAFGRLVVDVLERDHGVALDLEDLLEPAQGDPVVPGRSRGRGRGIGLHCWIRQGHRRRHGYEAGGTGLFLSSGFSEYTSSSTDMSNSFDAEMLIPAPASVSMFSWISWGVIVNKPFL
jgi:hypothetical protein